MLFSQEDKSNIIYLNSVVDSINECTDIIVLSKGRAAKLSFIVGDINNFFSLLKKSIIFIDEYFVKKESDSIIKFNDELVLALNANLHAYLGMVDRSGESVSISDQGTDFAVGGFLDYIVRFFKDITEFDENLTDTDNISFLKFLAKTRVIASSLSRDTKYLIEDINEKIRALDNKITDGGFKEAYKKDIASFLEKESLFFDEKTSNLLQNFRKDISTIQYDYENELKTKVVNLKNELESNRDELTTLLGDVKLYKSMVSEKTENEISKHYSLKADKEKRTYWYATSITASIIIASLGAAWFGLNDYYQNYVSVGLCNGDSFYMDDSYKKCVEGLNKLRESTQNFAFNYLVMRLIFSILLFLTVIYTSRIAIRAYSHWRHSENMHLKLASLRPFITQLETKERDQIHKDLVPDYFGKDAGMVETANEKFKDLPANVSAVAMKAIEQLSSNVSNPSTGKNTKNSTSGNE